jgi:hypothetical protein
VIQYKQGYDREVDATAMEAVGKWLCSKGISNYIDPVS